MQKHIRIFKDLHNYFRIYEKDRYKFEVILRKHNRLKILFKAEENCQMQIKTSLIVKYRECKICNE